MTNEQDVHNASCFFNMRKTEDTNMKRSSI